MDPYHIIASPFSVYVAPLAEAFPAINAAPAGGWVLVGTNGNKDISEDGITVTHEEEVEEFRMLGATGPIKASRVSEGLMISFVLHDLSLEQIQRALNWNTITTVAAGAGTAGHKKIGLTRGLPMNPRSLLLRGASPYGAGFNMQYEIPRGFFRSEAEIVYQRGEPAGYELTFVALVNLAAASEAEQFGVLRAQHQAPLP